MPYVCYEVKRFVLKTQVLNFIIKSLVYLRWRYFLCDCHLQSSASGHEIKPTES